MNKTSRLTLSAMFIAIMLVLSYVESLVPVGGMPGIKIGLANCVLLISLYWLGFSFSALLMLAKVFLTAHLFGRPSAIPFSLAGGVLSLLVMGLMVFIIKGVSPVGAGVAGAVAHNIGQIAVAALVLPFAQLLYYLAVLVLVAVGFGFVTGNVARLLMRYLPYERRQALARGLLWRRQKPETR